MTPILLITAASLAVVAALALGIALLLALSAALGAAFAAGWTPVAAALYERRQRRSLAALNLPPSQTLGHRHARPQPDPAAVDADEYWAEARAAAAVAELAPTVPMPAIGGGR